MKIECKNCGHTEETNLDLMVKVIGSAMPIGGYWAWTAYLFAGTGFAMGIVVAIIAGGTAMLAYKDEIVDWIINRDYKCESCGKVDWIIANEESTAKATGKAIELSVKDTTLVEALKGFRNLSREDQIKLAESMGADNIESIAKALAEEQ